MAGFVNQPRLKIDIIDDIWAEVRVDFDVDWNLPPSSDDFHQILIELWGEDDGIAGGEGFIGDREEISDGTFDTQGDDLLESFTTPTFYPIRGRILTVTGIQRVQRTQLDEDKGWGVIPRLRKKRDKDEIYAVGVLQIAGLGVRGRIGKSKKSNVIQARF